MDLETVSTSDSDYQQNSSDRNCHQLPVIQTELTTWALPELDIELTSAAASGPASVHYLGSTRSTRESHLGESHLGGEPPGEERRHYLLLPVLST